MPTSAAIAMDPNMRTVCSRDTKLKNVHVPPNKMDNNKIPPAIRKVINQKITPPIVGVPSFFLCMLVNIGALASSLIFL